LEHYKAFPAPRAGTPLGQRYAALCTACSIAERVRDSGGHALVVLDDISCMVRCHLGGAALAEAASGVNYESFCEHVPGRRRSLLTIRP